MSISDKLSEILYRERKSRGWSIEQMAGFCEMSSRYYGNLEKGKHLPRLDTAIRIAVKLDISLDNMKEEL